MPPVVFGLPKVPSYTIVPNTICVDVEINVTNGLHLPGRRCPEQTSQLPLAMAHPVAQVCAERHAAPEIVVPFDLLAPAAALRLAFHQHPFHGFALAGDAFDGCWFAARPRYICPSRTPSAQLPQIGK